MNGIGGTFKWSHKQIQAYARAFREGDAVKVGGEWYEVKGREVAGVHPGDVHAARPKVNPYNLNYRRDGDVYYEGVARGFLKSWVDSPHEVVTPEDYKVQKGDKLVWLGDTSNSRTFGWMYNVAESEDGRLVYLNNKQSRRSADSESLRRGVWGVIPRYENVKEEKDMDDKNEHSENTRTFKVGDVVKASEEKSPEQEALEYLLSREKDATRRILQGEIAIWANIHLEHGDYDDLRQATDILEKLEKGE